MLEQLKSKIKPLKRAAFTIIYIQNMCSNSLVKDQTCCHVNLGSRVRTAHLTIKPLKHATDYIFTPYMYVYHKVEHLNDH